MKLILESILGRVQRDFKVILCHGNFLGNHPHLIIVARDRQQCINFHGELKKQITDAIKRLTGKKHLNLWQKNGTSIVRYGDIAGAIERIAYIYANPARAGLADTIERYAGLSTWEAFRTTPHSLSAEFKKMVCWVRAPSIPTLPARAVTFRMDRKITDELRKRAKVEHELILQPNAWMKTFKVSERDVEEINKRIVTRLREFESAARQKRNLEGRRVMAASALTGQPLSLDYVPKEVGRRIFVYAIDAEIRRGLIQEYQHFCRLCAECYGRWKLGDYRVEWPPGAFLPAMPPRANYFAN